MGKLTIDGNAVQFSDERNLLEVIRKAGIDLPTFCYHSELSTYGACRMCLVEVIGGGIQASCSITPADGMEVKTNTSQVRKIRKMALELILANHDRECTSCNKSGDCRLQDLATRFGIRDVRFPGRKETHAVDSSSPSIVRDPNKCILCGDCVRSCKEVQGIGVLEFVGRGSKVQISPAFNKSLSDVECVYCGQCVSVCPTGALTVKDEVEQVWQAINDPDMVVVAQVAPAVRVSIGEGFGLAPGENVMEKLVASLKRMGIHEVFDTSFAADLTVIEETNEFLARLQKGTNLPQFTSCCPGWVKYAEQFHPELLDHLSSCKSPQQMFGNLIKNYYAQKKGIAKENVYVVSIMPCTAKKYEAQRQELQGEVDSVLTTVETIRMIKQYGIDLKQMEGQSFDMPFGLATGAGVIFGSSGGVSEAVLRLATSSDQSNGTNTIVWEEKSPGIKEAEIVLDDSKRKLGVVYGLKNLETLVGSPEKLGEYDLIEVMACPDGCVGGGGQPQPTDSGTRASRAQGIKRADKIMQIHRSQDNPLVEDVYDKWLGSPNSEQAHKYLHTKFHGKKRICGLDIQLLDSGEKDMAQISVCVGTGCYVRGAYNVLQELMSQAEKTGLKDTVNISATFCLENCDKGPSVTVNDKVLTGVSVDDVEGILHQVRG